MTPYLKSFGHLGGYSNSRISSMDLSGQ